MDDDVFEALQTVIGQTSETIAVYGLDGTFVYLNQASEHMFGRSLAELRGQRLFELYPDAVGNPFHQAFTRVAEGGEPERFDHYYAPFDAWFANDVFRRGDKLYVLARNVTEERRQRRKIETLTRIAQITSDEERDLSDATSEMARVLRQVLDAPVCSVALLSSDGQWLEVLARDTAAPAQPAPLLGLRWSSAIGASGEALRTRLAVIKGSAATQATARSITEPAMRAVIDTAAWSSVLASPLLAGDDAIGVMLVSRTGESAPFTADDCALANAIAPNIGLYIAHVRRRSEAQALRAQLTRRLDGLLRLTAKLAAAEEAGAIAHVLVDEGVDAIEATMVSLWLASPDGTQLEMLRQRGFLPQHSDAFVRVPVDTGSPLASCFVNGQAVFVESRAEYAARYPEHEAAHRPEPAPPLSFALIPLLIEGRRAGCVSFTFHEERRLSPDERAYLEVLASHGAEALRRARLHTERARLFEQATQAQREAETANSAKDQFLAVLGHELRNPLAPMTTALQLMQMRAPDQLERERAVIERQVKHLSRLVDDLLDVSRITRGKIELRRERVTLASVTAKAVEITSPLFEQRRQRLQLEVPNELEVLADVTRLCQVIANLLSNAAKYTGEAGEITLQAMRQGDQIVLSVRDNGIGIAADVLPRIFEMFVQAPQSNARTDGGLGLGLAIVKSLVEQHGGSVTAHSAGAGQGTLVTLSLPQAPPLTAAATTSPALAPRPRVASPRKILVVDDNKDAAESLAELLHEHGYQSRTAFDGPSGLQVAHEFRPDVAVLDIGLPVMDGYELSQRLRASPELGTMQLIALTGYGLGTDRAKALAAGFNAHLAKPVSVEVLLALVEAHAGSSPTP